MCCSQVGGAGGGFGGGGRASSAGGDDFQENLKQLQQVSKEQQHKQLAMRMLSAKLGSEQNAAKEKPSQ
jgi:hypothetical protein